MSGATSAGDRPVERGERPGPEHVGGGTWWHSRLRYLFAAQLAPGRAVLDLACGNGFGTAVLSESARSVVGADASADAIAGAARLNARANVRYERVDPPRLPWTSASFELVVCLETIEHMRAEDQPGFVAELERVLAPDGLLVLSTPDRGTELARARLTREPNPFHLHTPSGAELDSLLARFPYRAEWIELDLVATAIVPSGPPPVPDPTVTWALEQRAAPVSVLRACARTERGAALLRDLRPPLVCQADYQRLSQVAIALTGRRVPDLGGLPVDEQVALLAEHVRRLSEEVRRLEDDGQRVAQDVHLLNEHLSLAGWLERLRRLRARVSRRGSGL